MNEHESPTDGESNDTPPQGPVEPTSAEESSPTPAPEIAQPEPIDAGVAHETPSGPMSESVPEGRGTGPSTGAVVMIALVVTLLFGTIVGGTAGFAGGWFATHGDNAVDGGTSTVRVVPSETDEPVAAAAAAALPSVVNIHVSGEVITDDAGDLPEGHPGVPQAANGSGVAYQDSEDGGTYIITNAHVVSGASSIIVTGSDRERHRAELIGADEETDIAVVKIDGSVPLIETGDSDELVVGQLVLSIGSPYGLSMSVSSGVISAIGRSLPNSVSSPEGVYPLVDVIQTDARINPGNSGGALVNREGKLVGINSAIFSETGGSEGIGFAIPINRVMRVADELVASGEVQHPYLGVLGRTVDPVLAEQEDLPVEEGAYIVEVTEGTEAEKAGLRAGDVIVKLDDSDILSMDDLILEVKRTRIGDTVTLTLYRDGEEMQVEMTVGIKPKDLALPEETTPTPTP